MWNGVTIEFAMVKLHTAFLSIYCPFSPSPRPTASPTVRSHHPPNPSSNTSAVSRQCPCNGYLKIFNLANYVCYNNNYASTPHSYHSFFNTPLSYRLFYLPLPKFQNLHLKPFVVGLLRHRTFNNSVSLIIEIFNIRFSRQLIER